MLLADEKPIVAVENKIGAEFQDDQLASYGRWIKKAATPAQKLAVVCLLTHFSPPPPDFMEGGVASGNAVPHVVRWAVLGGLVSEYAKDTTLGEDVRMLAREFRRFLEESEMTTEYAGREDFAAALVYLRAGSRMDHTFSSVFEHIKSIKGCFQKYETKNEYSLKFDTESKIIWGWAYLSHPMLSQLYFGYGIALSPAETFVSGGISTQASIPNVDSVFIAVGADDKRGSHAIRASKHEPESPWTYAEVNGSPIVVSFKSLHEFMEDPKTFAQLMIRWIDEVAEDVNTFVKDLKQQ